MTVATIAGLRSTTNPRRALAAACVAAVGVVTALAGLLPVPGDYFWYYYHVPLDWAAGRTELYDEASRGYYLPPWAVWLFLPLAYAPPNWGFALFTGVSLAATVAAAYTCARGAGAGWPWLAAALAATCPYTLVMVFTGTPDGWAVGGLALAWHAVRQRQPWLLGVGVVVALVRPQVALLVVPALGLMIRGWDRRTLASAGVVPLAVVLLTVPAFGSDWPLRWVQNYQVAPPTPYGVVTTYTVLQQAGVPLAVSGAVGAVAAAAALWYAWRTAPSWQAVAVVVAANAVLAPYIRTPSYVAVLALAWVVLWARRPALALAVLAPSLAYVITFFHLDSALGFWYRLPVLDSAFPLLTLGALLATRPGRSAAAAGAEAR